MTACYLGCTQSGVFRDVNGDVQTMSVMMMEIMLDNGSAKFGSRDNVGK